MTERMVEQSQPATGTATRKPFWRRVRPSFVTVAALAAVLSGLAWLWSRWATAPPRAGRSQVVLAVLPFENASGDAEQEYWSDGLTDEVIAQLGSAAPGKLAVIAPATAAHYKRSRLAVGDIGRELAADYLLKGSLRRSGSRIRLAAELLSVAEQGPVWSASFEREAAEVLQLQGDLSRAVAGRIRLDYGPGVWPSEPRRKRSLGNVHTEAYALHLKGKALARQATRDGLNQALAAFAQAVALDPQLAAAHASLAEIHLLLAVDELVPPREVLAKARKEVQAALRLDDASAQAHGVYGMVRLYADWDWTGAEHEFQHALTLNPSEAVVRSRFGYHYLRIRGRKSEALAEVRRALTTDPLSMPANLALADLLIDADKSQQAVEQCRKALAISASYPKAYLVLGTADEDLGAFEQATAAFETAVRLSPGLPAPLLEVARLQALTGQRGEAQKTRARALAAGASRYVPPVRLAHLELAMGENESALDALERAWADKAVALPVLPRDARFDVLRAHPRYRALVKRLSPPA